MYLLNIPEYNNRCDKCNLYYFVNKKVAKQIQHKDRKTIGRLRNRSYLFFTLYLLMAFLTST